jgi:hypothetical protein
MDGEKGRTGTGERESFLAMARPLEDMYLVGSLILCVVQTNKRAKSSISRALRQCAYERFQNHGVQPLSQKFEHRKALKALVDNSEISTSVTAE